MSETAISIRKLTKSFGKFVAVRDLDIDVPQGQIYGFLGPNGAGKTTVIRILLGLMLPDDAEVKILGKNLFSERDQIMGQVGAIVETPCFFEYMSAFDNLYHLMRLSAPVDRDKIHQALETVGLHNVGKKKVGAFSLGMKQRLGIAQALLPDNRLLFLDEPTNGLDPHGIASVRKLLRRLCDEHNLTIFLSSHLLSEVEQTCDMVTIINKGVKICEEPVADLVSQQPRIELKTSHQDAFTSFAEKEQLTFKTKANGGTAPSFLIDGPESDIPEIARKLVAADIPILSLTRHQNSLEEIFVELTKSDSTDSVTDQF